MEKIIISNNKRRQVKKMKRVTPSSEPKGMGNEICPYCGGTGEFCSEPCYYCGGVGRK